MTNVYWTRAWIVQELLLSPEVQFLCPYRNLPTVDLVKLLLLVQELIRLQQSFVDENLQLRVPLPDLTEVFEMADSFLLGQLQTLAS